MYLKRLFYLFFAVFKERCHKEEHLCNTGERKWSRGNWYLRRQRSGNDQIQ